MLEAINGMQHVMQQAAHFLLSPPQVSVWVINIDVLQHSIDKFITTWFFMYARYYTSPIRNLYTLTWMTCGSTTIAFQRRLLYSLVRVWNHRELSYITPWHGDARSWLHSGYLPMMLRWVLLNIHQICILYCWIL